jgi:hypothetical protein
MQPSQKNSRSYEQCVEMCERIAAEHDWNGNNVGFKTWWTKAELYRKQKEAPNGHIGRVTDRGLEEEYEAMFGNPYGKAEMPRMEFREFFNPERKTQ